MDHVDMSRDAANGKAGRAVSLANQPAEIHHGDEEMQAAWRDYLKAARDFEKRGGRPHWGGEPYRALKHATELMQALRPETAVGVEIKLRFLLTQMATGDWVLPLASGQPLSAKQRQTLEQEDLTVRQMVETIEQLAAFNAQEAQAIAAPDSTWRAVTTAERFARSTMNRYHDEIAAPLYRAHEAGRATFEQVCRAEEGRSPYSSAHALAVNAVILTPAPDMTALIFKLDLGLRDGAFDGSEEAERMLHVLAEDLGRLANVERAFK